MHLKNCQKATISYVTLVCLSVRSSDLTEELGYHWTNFHEVWYLRIFRKSVEKIQFSLKSAQNNRYFTLRLCTFMTISMNHSYYVNCFRQELERRSEHILRSIAFCLWKSYLLRNFFFSVISNQSTWDLYELMCWLSLVVRSLPARSLSWIQSTVDWCMVPRKWGFDLKSNSTNYPDHGHHGDPPTPHKEKSPW